MLTRFLLALLLACGLADARAQGQNAPNQAGGRGSAVFVTPGSTTYSQCGGNCDVFAGNGGVTSGYTGPLDIVSSGAKACYSLRACAAAYATGSAKSINIRRASDNHGCDVLLATSGGLGNTVNCGTGGDNGQSAASFCASTSCYLPDWYEQTGSGPTIIQATAGDQPALSFNCLNTTLPCVTFNGTSQIIVATSGVPSVGYPLSYDLVEDRTGQFTSYYPSFSVGTANNQSSFGMNSANSIGCGSWGGGSYIAMTATDSQFNDIICVINGSSSALAVNGSPTPGTVSSTTPDTTNISVATTGGGGPGWPGKFTQVIIWSGALTSTQYGNVRANDKAWWGLP